MTLFFRYTFDAAPAAQRFLAEQSSTQAMPYFVYQIEPPLALTHIDTKDAYKDARALVRKLRAEQPGGDEKDFRMVFAKSLAEAEKLLSTPRDERVIGED